MIITYKTPEVKPRCDRYEVSQFGYIDLRVASRDGVVNGDLDGQDLKLNGIDEPESILGRPDDIFKAYRMKDYVSAASRVNSENSSTTPNGENPTE